MPQMGLLFWAHILNRNCKQIFPNPCFTATSVLPSESKFSNSVPSKIPISTYVYILEKNLNINT